MSDTSKDAVKSGSASRTRRRAVKILAAIAVVAVVLALALGLGLGLGLKKHHKDDNLPSAKSSDNSTASWQTAVLPNITREEMLGDPERYLLSHRAFPVGADPTTREYNWTVSAVTSAPGGIARKVLVVNGQSPGPILEANVGDRIIVRVKNDMVNTTTLHWHGMRLFNQNPFDGAAGITQCGIPPGGEMVYNWTAQASGTSWWHAHKSVQYTEGLYGAIVLHGRNETIPHYDDELTLVMADLYNTAADAILWRYEETGTGLDGNPGDEPVPDGGMVNGVSQAKCAFLPASDSVLPERRRRRRALAKGVHFDSSDYCGDIPTQYWNTTLQGGKTYRLRLINAGTFPNVAFSIDGHNLTIVEVEGTAVEPQVVSSVELAVAQRASVLVTLDQAPGAYWMRAVFAEDQFQYTTPAWNPTTLAFFRYNGTDAAAVPKEGDAPALSTNATAGAQMAYVPLNRQDAPPPTRQESVQFNMQFTADNNHYMFFNDSSYTMPPSHQCALLGIAQADSSQLTNANDTSMVNMVGGQVNLVSDDEKGVLDLIVNSQDDGDHPFHLHGHTFWVMSQGDGHFYGDSASLNVTNPMRRDTIVVPSYGHAVIRFTTDNPGVWAFHCHIQWHMEIGLLLTVTNLPAKIPGLDGISLMRDMCTAIKK